MAAGGASARADLIGEPAGGAGGAARRGPLLGCATGPATACAAPRRWSGGSRDAARWRSCSGARRATAVLQRCALEVLREVLQWGPAMACAASRGRVLQRGLPCCAAVALQRGPQCCATPFALFCDGLATGSARGAQWGLEWDCGGGLKHFAMNLQRGAAVRVCNAHESCPCFGPW